MAPRRPGTQPTEADPTLDIGAKRARVEGEDESSMQVQVRARTRACKSPPTFNSIGSESALPTPTLSFLLKTFTFTTNI
eukprot:scaffold675_cov169-Isochrysis_galbana.AAC.2